MCEGWALLSTAADGGDDVEPRALRDRSVQRGALAVDVDVDVAPQRRAFRDQPVAEPRPALLELVDRVQDARRRLELEAARQPWKQRAQGPRKPYVGHVATRRSRRPRRRSRVGSSRS